MSSTLSACSTAIQTSRATVSSPARSCTSWRERKRFTIPIFLLQRPQENSSGKSSYDPTLLNPRFSPGLLFFRVPFQDGATSIKSYLVKILPGSHTLPTQTYSLSLGKRAVNDCEREGVRRTLAEQGELLWSEATSGNYGARGREILSSLVLRGVLTIDMDSPISSATEFVPKNGSF